MKKEVAKAWVSALRSGKYQQGTGKLQTLEKSIQAPIAELNDKYGFTFNQIANLIEEQWEDL